MRIDRIRTKVCSKLFSKACVRASSHVISNITAISTAEFVFLPLKLIKETLLTPILLQLFAVILKMIGRFNNGKTSKRADRLDDKILLIQNVCPFFSKTIKVRKHRVNPLPPQKRSQELKIR